jgi:serine/threonine protein kinase
MNNNNNNNNNKSNNNNNNFLRIRKQIDKYDGQTILIKNQPVYELESWLGAGASGTVYQALDVSSQKVVAIKILKLRFKRFFI